MIQLKNPAIAVCLTLLVSIGLNAAVAADGPIIGRIHDREDRIVQVCVDRGVPLHVGERFDVVRHTILTQPKGATGLRAETVGTIRIAAADNEPCASADLVRGSAQALDWVVAAAN